MKYFVLFALLVSFQNVSALSEGRVFNEIKDALLNGKKCITKPHEDFWKQQTVATRVHTSYWSKNNYPLVYSKFGCGIGKNGSIIIAPGRTESSVEFYETALDFVEKGFSPIYVVDHVSQGFSPRLLKDPHKGHIYRFTDYIEAFELAVQAIEENLEQVEGRQRTQKSPLFFLSNSMGGAIGLGYFQKIGENNPFKAATLLGPMIRINYLGFPSGDPNKPNGITNPTTVQTLLFSELGVVAQTRFYCKTLGCDAYATKIAQETAASHGSAYVEGVRDFEAAFAAAPEQVMTHSQARYNLKTFLWESDKMKRLYKDKGLPNPQLAAPTYQWAKQAAKFNRHMRRDRNIKRMSSMPIKIITGEKDVRSYTPYEVGRTDLSEHIKFCDRFNMAKSATLCEFIEIKKAFHELHKESDEYRNLSLDAALDHFKSVL